jgi:hypothetical protein
MVIKKPAGGFHDRQMRSCKLRPQTPLNLRIGAGLGIRGGWKAWREIKSEP